MLSRQWYNEDRDGVLVNRAVFVISRHAEQIAAG